jgi:hypothetical protein
MNILSNFCNLSSKGILEEVTDESKTLRELKPFKNILKFSKRTRNRGQYHHLKEKVGKKNKSTVSIQLQD